MDQFIVEVVWNRESDFVGWKTYPTLDHAIKAAQDLENSGDGARVKKTRVVNEDGYVVWVYGKLVTK